MSRLRAVAALALTHHDRGFRALPVPGPTQRAILAANACTVLALLQPLGVTPRLNEYAGTVGLILGFLVLLVLSAGGVFVSWLLTWRRIRDGSLGTQREPPVANRRALHSAAMVARAPRGAVGARACGRSTTARILAARCGWGRREKARHLGSCHRLGA